MFGELEKRISYIKRTLVISGLVGILSIVNGCGFAGKPRPRLGTLPTPPPGPRFYEPDNLGKHSYNFNLFEKNGIVYTCKAGHIDITHLRCNADDTRYHIRMIKETLLKNKKEYSFSPGWEISKHKVTFIYPESWKNLIKKRERKDCK